MLDHKLVAEKYLRASGLNYTIVRPGGLAKESPQEVGWVWAKLHQIGVVVAVVIVSPKVCTCCTSLQW